MYEDALRSSQEPDCDAEPAPLPPMEPDGSYEDYR
jgi:hypothetical protein